MQFHEGTTIIGFGQHRFFCASLAAQTTVKEKVGIVKLSGVVVPPYSVSRYRLEID